MFQRLFAVARNTFVETVRQPIFGIILAATALMLILNVSLAAFTLEDDDKLLLSLGLSTLLLSGLFLAAFSAASVLSQEIENKTVLTVISKPISRPLFVLGKFAGLTAALSVAFYVETLVFILTLRHGVLQNSSDPWDAPVLALGFGSVALALLVSAFRNYFYGKDFPTTAVTLIVLLLSVSVAIVGKLDEHWNVIPFGSNFVGGQTIIAAYLVYLAVTITSAVALAASTRLGQLMTLVTCTVVLSLGIVSDYAFGQHTQSSLLAALAYRTVPNIGPFWVIDGLQAGTANTAIPLNYVGYVTGYALLLTTSILCIGIMAFERRELG